MSRGKWIVLLGGLAASAPTAAAAGPAPEARQVMTVRGPIAADSMGVALPHEHVMSTFGAPAAEPPAYDEERLAATVVPQLAAVKELGCGTLVDCTAAYFGRDPAILRRLSERSGIHILTNTGYYGAAQDRYVPPHAFEETADQLAERWLREWREGIGDTGIRPGFIKIAVDDGPLSAIDAKLVRAAARTHLGSGLTIAVHTGDNAPAARQQLAILAEEGVHSSAWIWVHAHKVTDASHLVAAAEAGGWIELDGINETSIGRHLEIVRQMKRRGLLGRVLLSHDGNSFPFGGEPRPYVALFTDFIPALEAAGFSPEEIRRLTRENPQQAFAVHVRRQR